MCRSDVQHSHSATATQECGQASWVAMSQALDESRNAFAKAIEITAKKFNEATKG